MQRLKATLMNNLGIKIASIILALSILAHVRSSEEREFDLAVPVRLSGLAADLTFSGYVPETVPIRLRARGLDEWRLRARPPQVRIDLSEARPGLLQRPISTSDVVLPGGADAEVRTLLAPVSLSLEVEPLLLRTVPVRPRLLGVPAEGFLPFGDVRVTPDSLWIRGPATAVEGLDSILTEEVDLSGRNQSVEERVVLVAPENIEMEVETVELRVPIHAVEEHAIGPVAVQLPPGLVRGWTTRPDSVRVRLQGPLAVLLDVRASDVVVRAQIRPPVRSEEEWIGLETDLARKFEGRVRSAVAEPESVLLVRR